MIAPPPAWMERGTCLEQDPEAMFVLGAAQHHAAEVCSRCPVVRECLAFALDNREEHGVWGGRTERERRALLKKHPGIRSWARLFSERAA